MTRRPVAVLQRTDHRVDRNADRWTPFTVPRDDVGPTIAPGSVGMETQWLVVDVDGPRRVVQPDRVSRCLADGALPGGSHVHASGLGTVAVTSPLRARADEATGVAARDLAVVRGLLAEDGLGLVGLGCEPVRDTDATACLPITVALSTEAVAAEDQRQLAAGLAVVLAAACANSPLASNRPTGFRSTRLSRSGARQRDLVTWRRAGHLHLRVADALPEPFWRVPFLVAATILSDPTASARGARAVADARSSWDDAARYGLAHPVLSHAARRVFDATLDALARQGASREAVYVVEAYVERFVARDRTPADDVLAARDAGCDPLRPVSMRVATPIARRVRDHDAARGVQAIPTAAVLGTSV
jgi:hypothetical protein